jgi:hypothetical protein
MRILLLFSITTLLVISCRKKNNQKEPELPPETQTGAYTFGCKVNGKVFLPRDGNGKPGLFAQYVNLGTGPRGGWHLNIPAYDHSAKHGVSIETDSLLLLEGRTYELKKAQGHASAFYLKSTTNGVDVYKKPDNEAGELIITKHDLSKRILAGRFWFTATNTNGEKVDVTDGRFDIVY